MSEREEEALRSLFREEFRELDEKLERQIKRSNQTINLFLIIIIFIVGGAFTFTSRVNTDLQNTKARVENIADDLTEIDGALSSKFPNTVPFGERLKRERAQRGVAK